MSIVMIGFLSKIPVRKDGNGKIQRCSVFNYKCDGGGDIEGILTNEAAIKYVRRKYPDETLEILMVESTKSKEEFFGCADLRAFMGEERLKQMQETQAKLCIDTEIPDKDWKVNADSFLKNRVSTFCLEGGYAFPQFLEAIGYDDDDLKYENVLNQIMEMKEIDREDTIILDTTGGPRDANMVLLMAAKMLSYLGYKVEEILYANINGSEGESINSVKYIYELIDVLTGVNEFVEFGNADTLRKTFGLAAEGEMPLGSGSSEIHREILELIQVMGKYSEALKLCQTNGLEELLKRISQAVKTVENIKIPRDMKTVEKVRNSQGERFLEKEILLQSMLSVVRQKFNIRVDDTGKIDLLNLVQWCMDNDLIQQAITLYSEHILHYLADKGLYEIENAEKFPSGYEDCYYIAIYMNIINNSIKGTKDTKKKKRKFDPSLEKKNMLKRFFKHPELIFRRDYVESEENARQYKEKLLELRSCRTGEKLITEETKWMEPYLCAVVDNSHRLAECLIKLKEGAITDVEKVDRNVKKFMDANDLYKFEELDHVIGGIISNPNRCNDLLTEEFCADSTFDRHFIVEHYWEEMVEEFNEFYPENKLVVHCDKSVIQPLLHDFICVKNIRNHLNHALQELYINKYEQDYCGLESGDCSLSAIRKLMKKVLTRLEEVTVRTLYKD